MKTLLIRAAIAAVGLVGWLAWRWPGSEPVDVPAILVRPKRRPTWSRSSRANTASKLRRNGGRLLKTYRVALGFAPEQHKEREGDGRTPEGGYTIETPAIRRVRSISRCTSRSDDKDKVHATSLGVPPGGDICCPWINFNGLRKLLVSHPGKDWTTGCVTITDAEIRQDLVFWCRPVRAS